MLNWGCITTALETATPAPEDPETRRLQGAWPPGSLLVPPLTVFYLHLLGDSVCTGSCKTVSGGQHPVLAQDGPEAGRSLQERKGVVNDAL